MPRNPNRVTDAGKKKLGALVRKAREANDWTQDELLEKLRDIAKAVSDENAWSRSTLSNLENGNHSPRWNTLADVAALEFIVHPKTGKPLNEAELFWIACERMNPETGEVIEQKDDSENGAHVSLAP